MKYAIMFGLVAGVLWAQPKPEQESKDEKALIELRHVLRGYWQEQSALPGAKPYDLTWEIFTHHPQQARLTDNDNESQQRNHDVIINIQADPVWFDLRFKESGREWVIVGIVKVKDGDVYWSRGAWHKAQDYDKAKGVVTGRPKAFDAAGEAHYILKPLKSNP